MSLKRVIIPAVGLMMLIGALGVVQSRMQTVEAKACRHPCLRLIRFGRSLYRTIGSLATRSESG